MADAPDTTLWLSFRTRFNRKSQLMGVKYLELTLQQPKAPADPEGDYSEEESSEFQHSAWSGFQCNRICIKALVTAGTPVHIVFHYHGKCLLLAAASGIERALTTCFTSMLRCLLPCRQLL